MEITNKRRKISNNLGNTGESIFKVFMENKGCRVIKSTRTEDIKDHIDYFVEVNGSTFSFDVKNQNSNSVWLEIKNVNGRTGSLHGKQTHFAFYFHNINKLAIVKRLDLVKYVEENQIGEYYRAPKGIYVPYHYFYERNGRKDKLIKTNTTMLKESVKSYREYNL